jgi:hypothetical protein
VIPLGRSGGRLPHEEQTWELNDSLTSSNHAPRAIALYRSMVRKDDHDASATLFAIAVLASFEADTLPHAT